MAVTEVRDISEESVHNGRCTQNGKKYFSQTYQSQLVLPPEMINSLVLVKPWISSGSLIYSCPWCSLTGTGTFIPNPSGCQDTAATGQCCQTAPYQVLLPHRECPASPNPFITQPYTELRWPTKDRRQPISYWNFAHFPSMKRKTGMEQTF